jgi:hypothetical protein
MHKIRQGNVKFSLVLWRVAVFVLTVICWCNQAIYAVGGWRALRPQDTADLNVLLPQLVNPGQGLWVVARTNSLVRGETVQKHYNGRHGPRGRHTRTLPFFNGAAVLAVAGPHPATAEEVVMANFIATLVPAPPPALPVLPTGTEVQIKTGSLSREIRIPVPIGPVGMVVPGVPRARRQVQIRRRDGVAVDANYCSIVLPAVPGGFLPGAAPAPTNVCTLYFKQ